MVVIGCGIDRVSNVAKCVTAEYPQRVNAPRPTWRRALYITSALAACALPPSAVAQTVIGFDDLAVGAVPITNQYHAQGVDFAAALSSRRLIKMVPAGEAQSGAQVLEITNQDAGAQLLTATMSSPQSSVSLTIGQFDDVEMTSGCSENLTAYDGSHAAVGATSALLPATPGSGFHTRLSLTSTASVITSFEVQITPGCGFVRAGIDDLRIGPPDASSVTVQVTGPGSVTGSGIICPAACSASFLPGTALNLSVQPAPGSLFTGWSGPCQTAASQPTCAFLVGTDPVIVGATFRAPTLTIVRSGTGTGAVESVPPGIHCGGSCTATYSGDSSVTLTAKPDATSSFSGWAGQCAAITLATCVVSLHGDQTAGAQFTAGPAIEPGGTSAPPQLPKPAKSLAVAVNGSGSVKTLDRANAIFTDSALTTSAPFARLAQIRCGIAGFVCFATVKPGTRIGLVARPGRKQVFQGWGGACAGTKPVCVTSVSANGTVSARFGSRETRSHTAALSAVLRRPRFHVRWKQSTGAGTLVVTGDVSKPSVLRLQLRRPFGGPLLTETLSTGAGAFSHTTVLRPGILAHGARLFPGGFIVSLQGRSGHTALPPVLQTVTLPAPPGGVVRHAYVTPTENGTPATSVLASGGVVWAHFVFATQPPAHSRLTISWYWPDGRLLATISKSNRPEIVSWLGDAPVVLPAGDWRVVLRAGGVVVSALRARVV